ncbi:outer membrane protein assembly factor BamB family protein [Halorussus salinus]|uniref:outer membrane protein assembly factor BamB family protein n=1 Tax=Halorussus salinus TaxID=1364935 RepID=UPI0010932183|nr:PQQ-binding-like beta-propeller repeat protein [Halorussus salinus]
MKRRALLAACGATLSAGCAGWSPLGGPVGSGCELAEEVPGDAEWGAPRGGPRNTASAPANRTPAPPLSVSWTFSIPGVMGTPTPTVVDGTAFVTDLDGSAFAIDAETGDRQWRTAVAEIESGVTVGDGLAVVTSDEGVVALDADDGTERWVAAVSPAYEATPVVADDSVYVPSDLGIVALDAADGTERWRYVTGLRTKASPAVADGTVFVGNDDAYVYALDAATGDPRWRFKTRGEVACSPAFAGGTVYAGSREGRVYALDAETGKRRWSRAVTRSVEGVEDLAVGHGNVYVGADERLHAVGRESGEQCWRSGRYVSRYSGGPAVGDGRVYAPTDRGGGDIDLRETSIGGFDAGTGELVWRLDAGDDRRMDIAPAIADGALFAGGNVAGSLAVARLDPR